MEENNDGWFIKSKKHNFIRRQDCPDVYEINGAIFIINIKILIVNINMNINIHIIQPAERDHGARPSGKHARQEGGNGLQKLSILGPKWSFGRQN